MSDPTPDDIRIAFKKAEAYDDQRRSVRMVVGGICAVLLVLVLSIFAYRFITPKLNLYASNTEKQAVIKEQEAISEAEVFAAEKRVIAAEAEAEARRIEAEGIADAQRIISETLTPEYLTWRFYEVLSDSEGDVIYVPTEAGLPILEATRNQEAPTP